MTKEFLYDNKIFDGTPPSLLPSPILQNIFRKVDSNKSSYLSNEDDIIKRINNNRQADIFNNFASFNSTDSSTPLINESESKYFRNDNINNFDMINTGKFDKFENNILGENNTLDSITEKTQKQSDQYKNKICDEINLKGNKREAKQKVVFKTELKQKLGRKKKGDHSLSKHNKFSNDDGSKRFMVQCIRSINDSINSETQLYESYKNEFKLYKPNLCNNLPHKVTEKKIIFDKPLREFFENFVQPKNCLKVNKDSYRNYNRKIIRKLIKLNVGKINAMFDTPFSIFFKAFLNDEKIINGYLILNEKFKTLSECFNDPKDMDNYYNTEQKYKIKIYSLKLLNGEIKSRNINDKKR